MKIKVDFLKIKIMIVPKDTMWFNAMNSPIIGIVKCVDTITNEEKIYIGTGSGLSEDDDITHIIGYGCKVTKQYLINFLK